MKRTLCFFYILTPLQVGGILSLRYLSSVFNYSMFFPPSYRKRWCDFNQHHPRFDDYGNRLCPGPSTTLSHGSCLWENRGWARLGNSLKVTQLASSRSLQLEDSCSFAVFTVTPQKLYRYSISFWALEQMNEWINEWVTVNISVLNKVFDDILLFSNRNVWASYHFKFSSDPSFEKLKEGTINFQRFISSASSKIVLFQHIVNFKMKLISEIISFSFSYWVLGNVVCILCFWRISIWSCHVASAQ